MPNQWEYRIEMFSGLQVERMKSDINRLGSEGWELVCSTAPRGLGADAALIFKRPGVGYFTEIINPDAGWGG